MASSSAHHPRGRCSISTRVGVGRSLAFGALSAGLPALAHGSSLATVLALVFVLAGASAAWSWQTRCTPRSAAALASTLLLGQLLVHLALMFAPSALATSPTVGAAAGPLHAHAAADTGVAAAGVAVMAALHLVAVVYGVIALLALERRALRFVVDCVRRIGALVGLGAAAPSAVRVASSALRFDVVGAADADARRARRIGRGQARRGPPARGAFRIVAA